ncbi:MAG TPA: signal peptide peptidase SppA [Candidatus Latescibacteria bacterium]|nr:signal peptide peptidase SppA [Candidatus Latescibacterota bacterium]
MNANRSALWLLVGVVLGFGLPVLAIIGLIVALVVSASQLSDPTFSTPSEVSQVSGPTSGEAVALIDITGPIVSGRADVFDAADMAASADIVPLIRTVAERSDIKALVLRVNSPGGSVVGSDEIYHALLGVEKPVVVVMKEVAASGAYYLSMTARHIIVNPNTLTGSIGVIGQFANARELMDKIGLEMTTIKSGESKDIGNPFREMTAKERAIFQRIIDETYDRFVDIVSSGRKMPTEQVRELADGRVYTGQQALDLGLVDALGYEEDAVEVAAELGQIEGEPRVILLKRGATLIETLLRSRGHDLSVLADISQTWLRRRMTPSLEFRWEP